MGRTLEADAGPSPFSVDARPYLRSGSGHHGQRDEADPAGLLLMKLNGKTQLAVVGTIAGILSALVSSCATIRLIGEKQDAKVAEYQQLKDEVVATKKAIDDHITYAEPMMVEHRDAMKLIPVLGERTLRTLADVQEIRAQLDRLDAKIDRIMEKEGWNRQRP